MRLLLCDDHLVFAESLALVLSDAGYHVVAVTRSLDESLAVLRHCRVDVCVLDVGHPAGTVVDRLAELRAAAPETQVVLLSGFGEPDIGAVAAEHGIRGLVYKDQRVADIIEAIERVHRGGPVPGDPPRRDAAAGPASTSEARRLADCLTEREQEVLCRLVRGEDTLGVATTMGITSATARSHIRSVLKKLGTHSRVEAAAAAVRYGLVDAATGEWRRC